MKDAIYVVCAAIGLVLVGIGLAQIEEKRACSARP